MAESEEELKSLLMKVKEDLHGGGGSRVHTFQWLRLVDIAPRA